MGAGASAAETGILDQLDDGVVKDKVECVLRGESTVLDVSGCCLSEIPHEIGELVDLTELNISNNALASLPESLTKLTSLEVLSVEKNQLSSVPAWLAKLPRLKMLDVFNNPLTTPLPDGFSKLSRQRSFNSAVLAGDMETAQRISEGSYQLLVNKKKEARGIARKKIEARKSKRGGLDGSTAPRALAIQMEREQRGTHFKTQGSDPKVEKGPQISGDESDEELELSFNSAARAGDMETARKIYEQDVKRMQRKDSKTRAALRASVNTRAAAVRRRRLWSVSAGAAAGSNPFDAVAIVGLYENEGSAGEWEDFTLWDEELLDFKERVGGNVRKQRVQIATHDATPGSTATPSPDINAISAPELEESDAALPGVRFTGVN